MIDSQKLLLDYPRTGSDTAFQELLGRYADLVYSAAVRLVNGDAHLAKDVTQMVFIDFARKARKLPCDTMLGGWLHHHTVFIAATTMRGERRRQLRERKAVEMNALQDHDEANLAQLAPILDEAICELGDEDRTAIMLRFFEKLDFRAVGEMLNSTEESARKRVTRAIEKLQYSLKRRDVTFSVAALGTALASEAVISAPAGLAAGVAAAAMASSPASGVLASLQMMTLVKAGIIIALAVAGVSTLLVVKRRDQVRLNQQDELLQQQNSQLALATAENARFSNRLAQAAASSSLTANQERDLLRLRNEVGRLRESERILEKLRQQTFGLASDETTNSTSQEQTVFIGMDVQNPGKFPWTRGMTLSSLVELAHGFTGSANRYFIGIKEPESELVNTFGYESVAGKILAPGTMVLVAGDNPLPKEQPIPK
jgi:RNA polymerase sigma factor (sigma-70 family)